MIAPARKRFLFATLMCCRHRIGMRLWLIKRWMLLRLFPPKPHNICLRKNILKKEKDFLILFFNKLTFGLVPVEEVFRNATIPDDCEISTDLSRLREASAVVFHLPDIRTLEGVPKFPNQLWIGWSRENQIHYRPYQRLDGRFDLTMSYKTDADTFWSYCPPVEDLLRKPVPKDPGKNVCFFASNVIECSGRTRYVARLMRYIQVDSYGKCLNNCGIIGDQGVVSKLKIMGRYYFDLSFENSIDDDYVTEKFYQPLTAGTVPIYLGAPNADKLAPGDHCFIDVADYKNPRELAEHLIYLANNTREYERYFNWKDKPLRKGFLDLMERNKSDTLRELCLEVKQRLDQR